MLKILQTRLHQGHTTNRFPIEVPALSDRYRGRLEISPDKCRSGCNACEQACPTAAISSKGGLKLDLGKCVFCTACVENCPEDAVAYTRDYRMAVDRRADLVLSGQELKLAEGMAEELHRIMGRALRLREVAAGSCNACDLDTNVLNTVGWDLSRFGIQFVASPRHADGIVVTGAISKNMELALKETYDAVPAPKVVIAIGACAISGGPYVGSPDVRNGVEGIVPVDLYIPGCPPHPLTILDGLLRLIRKIQLPKTEPAPQPQKQEESAAATV